MEIPTKQLTHGFSLPVYGLGTWQMGGRNEADDSNDSEEIAAIRAAIDLGVTHIDTAESYGDGHSEELVGEAIKGYDRSKLVIATKVSGHNQTYQGVLASCAASLQRLGTNYIDLYYLHRYPDAGIDIADTMRAMDKLVADGKIRNVGVCNMSVNRLQYIQEHTINKIVCNQVHYSLRVREAVDQGVIEYCQQNDILINAWGPLEKGMLAQGGLLDEMAEKYGKTPFQVALNWLISQQNIVTIPKTSSVKHLRENLGAIGWELSVEDRQNLTTNFPN
jgi:diketogulonate reductase-like aldo/keto reductase